MYLKINNKNIVLTSNKITSPTMIFEKNGQKFYGALLNKKPAYPTFYIESKYLTSIDVTLGSYSVVRNHNGGSNGTYSSWQTNQLVAKHGFIRGVKFSMNVIVTGGNYDYINFETYIVNKNDENKSIYLAKGWGSGDNWTSSQSFSYIFSEADLEKLGGPNTELVIKTRMMNNRGSSHVYTTYTFTLETY